jgi:hypothetical protein
MQPTKQLEEWSFIDGVYRVCSLIVFLLEFSHLPNARDTDLLPGATDYRVCSEYYKSMIYRSIRRLSELARRVERAKSLASL